MKRGRVREKYRCDRRLPKDDVLQELIGHGLTYGQIALMYDVRIAAVGAARNPERKRAYMRAYMRDRGAVNA
jgi:hypothetical protein